MYITYDDTFEGLLSALYFYYTQPDITFVRRSAALPLIAYSPHITHVQNAQKIASRIRRRFGEVAYENIYFAFFVRRERLRTNHHRLSFMPDKQKRSLSARNI